MNTVSCRIALALLLAGTVSATQAQGDAKRWILGSWVNVRATNAADGPVVDHLTTNTAVTLRADVGKSCEIGWKADGRDGHGFVPCRLLGDRALTIGDVGMPVLSDGKPNPRYSVLRAFWLTPSVENLFLAGKYFADTLLNPAQRALEQGKEGTPSDVAPRLVRYPVPEFDAMKAVLAKGVTAPGGGDPWSWSCEDMLAGKVDAPSVQDWQNGSARCQLPGMALRLPAARPSLFKRGDRILPSTTTVENISAAFNIVERGKALGRPKWEYDRYNDTWRYTGAWDIGEYEVTLDKPVVEHVVGRTGLVGAYEWVPQQRITPNGIEDGCASGRTDGRRGTKLLSGYPSITDELLWFHAPQALPYKTARSKTHVERGPKPTKDAIYPIKRVAVHEIDLNGDGVPDFVKWEIWGTGALFGDDPAVIRWEEYVNIGGRWYPFTWNYEVECT